MDEPYPLPLTRKEEAEEKPLRLIRAAARIAIVMWRDNEHRCLFVRHQTKGLELPGGAIEAGELPQQSGLRELNEEAGIQLPTNHPLALIDMIPVIDHRGGNWLDIIYSAVAMPGQLTTQEEAELPICWLNAEEIKNQVDQQLSSFSASLRAINMAEQ